MVLGRRNQNKNCFFCEVILTVKRFEDMETRIMQLEITFRDRVLTRSMKYKRMTLYGKTRSFDDIKKDLIKEF